jgi:hypothetical protein
MVRDLCVCVSIANDPLCDWSLLLEQPVTSSAGLDGKEYQTTQAFDPFLAT